MRELFLTPVLLLVFNRPDKTQIVFERIRLLKPKFFYIAADGARMNKDNELQKCNEVRAIVENIDWDCEPKFLYRDENLGCSMAIVSAIDWFFEREEVGIIIEDDCLPDLSFFPYCTELLKKYQDDMRVMMISGTNLGMKSGNSSYFFSKYGQIWGWATWRRAWMNYERNIQINDKELKYSSIREKIFWERNFSRIIWDVQWAVYSIWKNNGISILPNVNLISNIGFDSEGTNYKDENSAHSRIEISSISFPLIHPDFIEMNPEFDSKFFKQIYYKSLYQMLHMLFLKVIRNSKLAVINHNPFFGKIL
jgi:hypothetical protein